MKISLVSIKTKLFIMKNYLFKMVSFFDLMHFRPCPAPSGGFLKKEAPPGGDVSSMLMCDCWFVSHNSIPFKVHILVLTEGQEMGVAF